MKPRHL